VIGAGPGGMEYARVAASRGHEVTIWEQTDQPGGQLFLAAAPPGRKDFLNLATYLANACKELGVDIQYGIKATSGNILSAVQDGKFNKVVIATGARPIMPPIPIEEGVKVVQAWDVLAGSSKTGKNVIIVGGGAVGVETALLLAESGTLDNETLRFLILQQAETANEIYRLLTQGNKQVTVLEMDKGIGRDIGRSTRWSMLADLKRHRVNCLDETKVLEVRRDGVLVESSGTQQVLPADTVILAVGSRPQNELYQALQGKVEDLSIIGDAAKPRKALAAIHDAYNLAKEL